MAATRTFPRRFDYDEDQPRSSNPSPSRLGKPMWIPLLYGGLSVTFLTIALVVLWHLCWVRRLPPLDQLARQTDSAASSSLSRSCSVVVAARDEAARIEGTVRHLLAQRDVDLEVIVVDDRSTDDTGAIVRRLATEDQRLRSLRVESLPEGWLGKCHACHVGAEVAQREWILFTDADCWLSPDALQRALGVADRDQVDHVTLTPGVAAETLGAQAWHLAFLMSASNWISAVNRDRPGAHLGVGAFNLVRRAAYLECGGHEALRMTVVDDVKLGLLLARAGKRTRAFIGGDDVECHWGTTVRSMIKIMEKNYFAVIDYRLFVVVAIVLVAAGVAAAIAIGPFTGAWIGWLPGPAWMSLSIPALVIARRLGWSWPSAVLAPLVLPVLIYAMVNSAATTLRQGGIFWRATFYPLSDLRKGNVQ